MELNQSIKSIKGIGEKRRLAFNNIGVESVYDLISYFPYRYEDRTAVTCIKDIEEGQNTCVDVIIANEPVLSRIRKGLDIVTFHVVDDTGKLMVQYFNQPYIKNQFHKGDHCIFYGKVQNNRNKFVMYNPVADKESSVSRSTGSIIPIYHSTGGLTQSNIKKSIDSVLSSACSVPDFIPEDIRDLYDLYPAALAYEQIHHPTDFKTLKKAQNRFIFEELFSLSLGFQYLKNANSRSSSHIITIDSMDDFYAMLPFEATNAQMRAINDIKNDMCSGMIMNRLIQGDVGSGKTVIAASAIWMSWKNGHQSALMVPTELLAKQHYKSLKSLFRSFEINICLLTGSLSIKEKNEIKTGLNNGKIDLVIGTHALFSADVSFYDLGLVITDEQHRFGVKQRDKLALKGNDAHIMVMSATPIPRTLALMIYGDLDVSIVDELPPNRKTVKTYAVNNSYQERILAFIKKTIDEGHQVYVVCPAIDDNKDNELLSVKTYIKSLYNAIPSARIEALHGKMDENKRTEIMSQFSEGNIDILVSTTVIEVGVDVPNATLIIIEDADRFGLSQLHQLRGRVGRSRIQSYCILVSNTSNPTAISRLKTMTEYQNGFKIAEKDLELRGPGDFFGSQQHGLPPIRIANLCRDINILNEAQSAAIQIIRDDPHLVEPQHRLLRDHIENNIIIKPIN